MIICYDAGTGAGCEAANPDAADHCRQCGSALAGALRLHNPGARIGAYRVVQVLGWGGFGAVYEAVAESAAGPDGTIAAGQHVALKQNFAAADTAQFRREFSTLSQLAHPNLPRYYDVMETGGAGYLVMELVPGQNLAQLLEKHPGGLAPDVVLGWAMQLCSVLCYLHDPQRPILHRDIKPANIRLTPDGRIKLVDFGLFKPDLAQTRHSLRGLGTPAYAPLEQYGGGTTPASDIYSLGATLYHLLSGQAVPDAVTRATEVPDPLPPLEHYHVAIPRSLAAAITRALAVRQDERFATAEQFRAALAETNGRGRVAVKPTQAAAKYPRYGRTAAPAPAETHVLGGEAGNRGLLPARRRPLRWLRMGLAAGTLGFALLIWAGARPGTTPVETAPQNTALPRRLIAPTPRPTTRIILGNSTAPAAVPSAGSTKCGPGWRLAPLDDSVGGGNLGGVAAIGPDDAWAVGTTIVDTGTLTYQTLTAHWDGQTWRRVPSPNASAAANQLTGVTALAANDVWAVGYDRSENQLLLMHWDGRSWQLVPNPKLLPVAKLYAVAGVGPRDVWAVGAEEENTGSTPLALHWDGDQWAETQFGSSRLSGPLVAVAAVAPDDVWAVGGYAEQTGRGLRLHWDGTAWTAEQVLEGGLTGLGATGRDDIWAVGVPRSGAGTLVQHWDGRYWRTMPSPGGGTTTYLSAVVARGQDDVWAVGFRDNDALTIHWDGANWREVVGPAAPAADNRFAGLAMAGTQRLLGVGYSDSGRLPLITMLDPSDDCQ